MLFSEVIIHRWAWSALKVFTAGHFNLCIQVACTPESRGLAWRCRRYSRSLRPTDIPQVAPALFFPSSSPHNPRTTNITGPLPTSINTCVLYGVRGTGPRSKAIPEHKRSLPRTYGAFYEVIVGIRDGSPRPTQSLRYQAPPHPSGFSNVSCGYQGGKEQRIGDRLLEAFLRDKVAV